MDEARHQMALLAGKSPAEWTAPDFDLTRLKTPAATPVSLPSTLIKTRPDILESEAELHAATAQIGVAIANQYPDIKLTANLTQSAIHPEDLFNYSSSGWSLLSGVTAPVLRGGTLKAQRSAAEAEARAALARYQEVVLRAFVQVSDVLSDLATDDQAIVNQNQTLRLAELNVRDYENGYRLGGTTLLQLVDAQRTLSRARRALVTARAQRFSDLVQLYAATAATYRPETQEAAR
jgi:NodT family efflux transporter outer membrane factor (OMF) lipoprotein